MTWKLLTPPKGKRGPENKYRGTVTSKSQFEKKLKWPEEWLRGSKEWKAVKFAERLKNIEVWGERRNYEVITYDQMWGLLPTRPNTNQLSEESKSPYIWVLIICYLIGRSCFIFINKELRRQDMSAWNIDACPVLDYYGGHRKASAKKGKQWKCI